MHLLGALLSSGEREQGSPGPADARARRGDGRGKPQGQGVSLQGLPMSFDSSLESDQRPPVRPVFAAKVHCDLLHSLLLHYTLLTPLPPSPLKKATVRSCWVRCAPVSSKVLEREDGR